MLPLVVTADDVRKACNSYIKKCLDQHKKQLDKVKSQEQDVRQRFASILSETGASANAFLNPSDFDLTADACALPPAIAVGHLLAKETGQMLSLPALLPFTASAATGFYLNDNNREDITQLLQLLAFRVLLSAPVELVKFHVVDIQSLGSSSKQFNRLSEKITRDSLVTDARGLSALVSELEDLISQRNRSTLINHKTLREYNADSSQLSQSYHFVIIHNLQDRISNEMVDRIRAMCSGMNATNCGVYVFYTIDSGIEGNKLSSLDGLLQISTLVSGESGSYCFSQSIYGKDFENHFTFNIDRELPQNIDEIISSINMRADNVKPQIVSFDAINEKMMSDGSYWQEDSTDGLQIPIGRTGANKMQYLYIAGNTQNFFVMIGGRPGYGKTVLLHDIICNGAILYSPQELEFYLIDCTNGTGFKPYANLPHARFVSISRQREYTHSALEFLVDEMYHRADEFKRASEQYRMPIDKIEAYRKASKQVMSRIVVVIDEFQVLLETRDMLSNKIRGLLDKIIREGRKYGISIIFCTQRYGDIDFNTDLITLRIAFSLKESDSLKVLGSGNDSASHLTKRGEAIINDNNGDKEANIVFQAAFTNMMQQYVAFCADRWEEFEGVKPRRFVNDGSGQSDLSNNDAFLQPMSLNSSDNYVVYLGAPMFMRGEHEYVVFNRGNGSNLLVCGTDRVAAVSTLALVNYQIAKMLHIDDSSEVDNMLLVDYFVEGVLESNYLREFARMAKIKYLSKKEVATAIEKVHKILKERINEDMNGMVFDATPYFISILYIQNAFEFRRDNLNRFPAVSSQLQFILQNGPDYGIHVLVYSDTYKGLSEVLDVNGVGRSFRNRLMLCDGATDLQLKQEVDKLSTGCGLLETADNTTTYDRDPVLIYNQNSRDYEADDTLKHVFSIYQHNANGNK